MPTLKRRTYRQKREQKELGYRKSKNWKSFYGSKAWQKLREWKITQNPICECCLKNNIITPATEIHHLLVFGTLKTKEQKWDAFLNPEVLCSLCTYHHHLAHKYLNKYNVNYMDIDTIVSLENEEKHEENY